MVTINSYHWLNFFFATDLLQMSKAKLEDLFLLVVLSEGQSAKMWTSQNLRTEQTSQKTHLIGTIHFGLTES